MMGAGHVAALAVGVYLATGIVLGVVGSVGLPCQNPRVYDKDEVDGWSKDRLIMAALIAVCWPLSVAFDDDIKTGWRYLTTDWDPWEEKGDDVYITVLPNGLSGGGQLKSAAPSGYNADEPTEVEESSDVLEGHRVWRLYEDEHGPVLASTIANHLYHGPVAETDRSELDEGRGLFAAKPGHPFYDGEKPQYVVEGTVELFGRVVEGRKGYRAENLRITSLTLRPGGWHEPVDDTPHPFRAAGIGTPENVASAFCSCQRAARPWPYPYREIVEALEERYRCDVTYEPRDGGQVFEGRCGPDRSHPMWVTVGGDDSHDPDRVLTPGDTSLLTEPSPEDIRRYGGTHGHR